MWLETYSRVTFVFSMLIVGIANTSFANSLDDALYLCRIKKIASFYGGNINVQNTSGRLIQVNTKEKTVSGFDGIANLNIDFEEGVTGVDSLAAEKGNAAYKIHATANGKFLSRMILFRRKDGAVHLIKYSDILMPMVLLGNCTEY